MGLSYSRRNGRSHWAHSKILGSLLTSQGGNGVMVGSGGNRCFFSSPSAHTPSQLALTLTFLGQASLRKLMKAPHPVIRHLYITSIHMHTEFCLQFLAVSSNTGFACYLLHLPHAKSLQEKVFSQGRQRRSPGKGRLGSEEKGEGSRH